MRNSCSLFLPARKIVVLLDVRFNNITEKMQFAKMGKLLGCQSKSRFENLMIDTLKLQETNLLKLLPSRGNCFSLFALDAASHLWQPSRFKEQVQSNLTVSNQHISEFYYNLLLKHFPKESKLQQKYGQLKWPSDRTFKINNKTVVVKDVGEQIKEESYDRLLIEVAPHQELDVRSSDPTQQDFKTVYKGEELGAYMKSIFAQQHLHFKDNKFYLKFNEKLVKNLPSNIVYNYIMKNKGSQLQLEFIDLPFIYSVEDISMRKSLEELQQTLKAANFLNIFTKLQYIRDFPSVCQKCSSNKEPVNLPTGYLSILTQDPDLHSPIKAKYMLQRIWKACHQNNNQQTYLVVVGDEYAGEVRAGLKQALKGQLKFHDQGDNLIPIRKNLIDNAINVEIKDISKLLKKSVLLEMLYESNTSESLEAFKQIDEKIANDYLGYLKEYDEKLDFDALNPEGSARIQQLFNEQMCPGLELMFGGNGQPVQNNYDPAEIEKIFAQIDTQIKQSEEAPNSGKIKPNIDNL